MSCSQMTELLQVLRINAGQTPVGLLSVELLLHVSQGPKRMAELELLTGCKSGSLTRAVRSMCVWFEPCTGKVHVPPLLLLQRRKCTNQTGYRIWLNCNGRKLLGELGLYP